MQRKAVSFYFTIYDFKKKKLSKTIKIEIFTLAFLLLSLYGYTQNKTDTTTPDISVVSLKKLTVNVLGIEAGFGYEKKISRSSIL